MKIKSNNPDLENRAALRSQAVPDLDSLSCSSTGLVLKQILVPIDFSDCSLRALDLAITIAQPFGARLTLLHVVEPAVYQQNYLGIAPPLEESTQTLVEAGRERLAALSRKRVGHRLRTESLVRVGHAHSEIPDTASALSADLIVMGTHGYTGLRHALLGSTTERVVRHAVCPVLTVRLPATATAK
jgi:nucleotide-binding universal stress UspA family protein